MSGYQVEGGFNGPGEPANNWVQWERSGKVEPSGIAIDFWNRAEEYLDRTVALGCDMVRIGVEWARVEPDEGAVDKEALERYGAILDAARERGLEPLVTLHHFTHPAWLGGDFWLSSESPTRYAEWVRLAVDNLGSRCSNWVTLNELNLLAPATYMFGKFPPGRRMSPSDTAVAADHLLSAHVKGYEAIHEVQPDATVTTNNASASIYEIDRIYVDVLDARASGVARDGLRRHIAERRQEWYENIAAPSALEGLVRARSAARAPSLDRAAESVYSSPFERCLDVVSLDYYDPVASHHVRMPGRRTAGGRNWSPETPIWDDVEHPEGLTAYLRASALEGAGIWIAENGLCNRVRRGRSYDRLDGFDRPRFLKESIAATVTALEAGIPVSAYLHWSLVDNYEWGSYEPRFGIHGVDRERGGKVLDTDAMGNDSAGAFRRIVQGLRSGDRSVLA